MISQFVLIIAFISNSLFAPLSHAALIDGEIVPEGEESSVFAFVQIKTKPEHVHDYGVFKPHVCTAFPITPTLLLTAAHCIVDKNFYQLSLTNSSNASRPSLDASYGNIETMLAHPQFKDGEFEDEESRTRYDIAFIRLSFPLLVKPLALPDFTENLLTGVHAKLIGYGISTWDARPEWGKTVAVKRRSTLKIGEVLSDYFFIPGKTKNVAPGDSGGPVIINSNGTEKVIGIVSGMKEPEGENPRGIFHRLTRESLCWVQENSSEDLGLSCQP